MASNYSSVSFRRNLLTDYIWAQIDPQCKDLKRSFQDDTLVFLSEERHHPGYRRNVPTPTSRTPNLVVPSIAAGASIQQVQDQNDNEVN
jgi:hypothetical protein